MEVSNNIIKINEHLSLNLEQALKDEAYLLSYAGVLSELQQQAEISRNILLILIIAKLLIKVNKKSLLQQDTLWLKNIIENINFDKVIYSSINLNINFYKNYKSAILQLIASLESLSDESKFDQPTVQKITVYLKQHATNLLIADNWEIESNFPFAGPRSKKTQAIDNLFKSEKRDTEWLQKLYSQSVTWQKEENNSFWQLSARTEAVQKLAYRTAQELVNRYSINQQIALSAVLDNFINIINNNTQDHEQNNKHNGRQWDKQGTFGCPTGIKKLRDLAKKREKIGDFRFLWMARNIIEERVKPNLRENPFSIFSQIKRSPTTKAFYSGFLEKCDYSNENFLEDLSGFLNTFKGDKPFLDRNSLMRPPSILIL